MGAIITFAFTIQVGDTENYKVCAVYPRQVCAEDGHYYVSNALYPYMKDTFTNLWRTPMSPSDLKSKVDSLIDMWKSKDVEIKGSFSKSNRHPELTYFYSLDFLQRLSRACDRYNRCVVSSD